LPVAIFAHQQRSELGHVVVPQYGWRHLVMGIRDKSTAPASPWQNGFAERLIGSIRRECVDHFVVLGEAGLRRILRAYASYHHHYVRV
jgi:transposase InsO family protein